LGSTVVFGFQTIRGGRREILASRIVYGTSIEIVV
jgi:hypothetical protein